MTKIERQALVNHSAQKLFALVDDVRAYPELFAWCESAEVLAHTEFERVARLDIRIAGIRQSFTTKNTVSPPHRLEMALVEGPFKSLSGVWEFTELGPDACKIALTLNFEVAGAFAGAALALGFHKLGDRIVDDFCQAADRIYAGE